MAKVKKTNALRQLDQKKIAYEVQTYDVSDGLIDGVSVAKKTGHDVDEIFKTLVLTDGKDAFVTIIPVAEAVDLKKVARLVGVKKLELLPLAQLTPVTGYERGGCSPVGMKKLLPTIIDERANDLDELVVSAGRIGMQMKLKKDALVQLTNATIAPITKE